MYQNSSSRWSAVSQRDPAAHCSFLYGVKTTKIYCRPTCTARLARRANVVYYDTIEQAQRDGYRACQRCKPDDVAFFGQREEVVVKALELLRSKQNDTTTAWSLKELAREVSVTPSYLCRVFKKTMGTTIGEYMKQSEMQMDKATMESTSQSPDTLWTGAARSESHSMATSSCASDHELSMQSPQETGAATTSMCATASQVATTCDSNFPAPSIDQESYSLMLPGEVLDLNFDFEDCDGLDFNDWLSFPDLPNIDLPVQDMPT